MSSALRRRRKSARAATAKAHWACSAEEGIAGSVHAATLVGLTREAKSSSTLSVHRKLKLTSLSALKTGAETKVGHMSSQFDDLLKQIPIGDIAQQVGVDPEVASAAIAQILPTLVGGMAANVQDSGGAESLTKALSSHKGKLESSKKVTKVDTAEGDKIVSHVFGSKKDEVVKAVAGEKGVGQDIIAKILPIVAPIVLAWLAHQFFGGSKETANTKSTTNSSAPDNSKAGGIGDLLGGLLGGGAGGSGGGDILGGLIGGLLGGKK